MNSRIEMRKASKKKLVQSKVETKDKDVVKESNARKGLLLLKNGEIHLIDVEAMAVDFLKKPSLADILQYELHNYCKKNMNKDSNISKIVKLSTLCYTKVSVSQFSSLDRFIGCVYYISSYLLKNEKYAEAIEIACSLKLREPELTQVTKNNKDVFNFLCTLHSSFMTSAIDLVSQSQNLDDSNYIISHKLAVTALKFFQFNRNEQFQIAKKVVKKTKLYFQKLQQYNDEDLIEFHDILKSVMKIMHPQFCHFDCWIYFLFKIEQLQNLNYSDGKTILQGLEGILKPLQLLCDFSTSAQSNLISLLNFFFHSPLNNPCATVSEIIMSFLNSQNERELLFLIVSIIFHHGIQHWWKLFEDVWSTKVSVGVLKDLFRTMLSLTKEFHKSFKLYCSSSKTLYDACFGDLLTGNLQKIQYTVRQCLKNKLPESLSLIPLSRQAFQLCIQCVHVMETMGCCKMQRSYAWKFSVIHQTNLVEDIVRLPTPTSEAWNHLSQCSQEVLQNLVKSDFELPYDSKRVNILFQRWHQAVMKLQRFNEGLLVCAAFYVSYPKEEADIISLWLLTKRECGNEIFQEMTFMDVLKSFESPLKEFNSKFTKNSVDLKAVNLMELKAYGSCPAETFKHPKIQYNLVSRIRKQLDKLNMDLWETSFAYTCVVTSNISGEGKKLSKNVSEKCNLVINQLTRLTHEGKLQCRSFVHAGNLRFSLFLYNVKQGENSENAMESNELVLDYLKKAEEEKIKFGEDVDLNLTCNVIPASSHLTVELEANYLNDLDEILGLWQKALNVGTDVLPTPAEYEFWLQNVQLVAYFYELYGEYHRSLTAWLMFYKIGKLCNDSTSTLLGLIQLLRHCSDVEESELFGESDSISQELEAKNQDKDVLVAYWLTLASNHLKNKKETNCLEQLMRARKVLESLRMTTKVHALHAKFWCLVSQFLTLYPDREVEFGYRQGTDLRVIVFKAFDYAVAGARSPLFESATQAQCTELVLTMLEVNIWAYHFHETYHQTDFMRFFLDDLYQIVQKLFLPTRTAEVLIRLAEVDMICEKTSDCREKISKLKNILTMPMLKSEDDIIDDEFDPVCLPRVHNFDNASPRAISPSRFLDPEPVSSRQTDDVSPIHLHLAKAKRSNASEHGSRCKCRVCQNLLIQLLTMTTVNVEAEIFKIEKHFKKAAACYRDAHKLLAKLESSRIERTEAFRIEAKESLKMNLPCIEFFLTPVQFYSARFLLKHATFEALVKNSASSSMYSPMEKISVIMKKFSFEKKLLMWKFSELKLLWLVLTKGESKVVHKGTPKEFRILSVTKTPFACQSRSPTSVRKTRLKNNADEADDKNTAFLGSEKVLTGKKLLGHPRKLRFRTNEPASLNKTVKKAPPLKLNDFKPKKLNLDQMES